MDRTNDMYGNKTALGRYCGFDGRVPPLWGVLQHAGNPGEAFLAGERHSRWWPRFVFNRRNLERAIEMGYGEGPGVEAIGDPFLYLDRWARGTGAAPALPGTGAAIAYPRHADGRDATIPRNEAMGEFLEGIPGVATVCLHFHDWSNPGIRAAYARRGFRVTSHGAVYEAGFLRNQHAELLRHDRVIGNASGTAVWHGGALGLRMEVKGIEFTEAQDEEWNWSLATQRERNPELFADEGLGGEVGRARALEELGVEFVRPPAELRRLLGWSVGLRWRGEALAPARRAKGYVDDLRTARAQGAWDLAGMARQGG